MDTAPSGCWPSFKGVLAVWEDALSWSNLDASAPLQVVAELWSFIEGELQVEPNMARHGYDDDDDDFDIVEADGWNQYDSYAMRRAPQQPSIDMTQQMTTKVAPAYGGTNHFLCLWRCNRWLVWHHRAWTRKTWDRLWGTDWKVKHLSAKDYWTEICWETPTMVWAISRDSCDLISSRVPKTCSYIEVQRQEHEEHQANLAQVAAAQPGQESQVNVQWTDEHALAAFRQLNENRRAQQRMAFPLGDNLLALIFVSLADLTQDQRNTLRSIMTHRGRTLDQYNVQELRDLFLDMFCTTNTAVDNPMMQPSGIGHRRSFLVLEEGELEGNDGYWAEDDEDGAEGFLDALEDVFWVYDDADYTWYQRRFQGRQTRQGKGKGRRKGKGKAKEDEGFFLRWREG